MLILYIIAMKLWFVFQSTGGSTSESEELPVGQAAAAAAGAEARRPALDPEAGEAAGGPAPVPLPERHFKSPRRNKRYVAGATVRYNGLAVLCGYGSLRQFPVYPLDYRSLFLCPTLVNPGLVAVGHRVCGSLRAAPRERWPPVAWEPPPA